MTPPLLHVEGLGVSYGATRALDGIDLDVGPGELVGLIGPNGAGKTTLVDALTGFVPAEGSVAFAGTDITRLAPHRRAHAGLGRTWQSLELFDDLTVRENLGVACRERDAGVARARIDGVLGTLGLTAEAERRPLELSQGQRKLVGVARALAGSPALVCMDEPAAGLDTRESEALGDTLAGIVRGGTSILLIDHDMNLVLNVCTELLVLDFGRVIARGTPEEIRADPAVIGAYLGGTHGRPEPIGAGA